MNLTYSCPKCHGAVRQNVEPRSPRLVCSECSQEIAIPIEAIEGNAVRRCLACPSQDLYIRKDFPQRLGVGLVAIGVVGSCVAWYYESLGWTFGVLFATAAIDSLLYWLVGDCLMCYRCGAQYRGVAKMETHGRFDLETHEKYRQLAARTATKGI